MAKKILKQVSLIRDFCRPEIDYSIQKSISYSQTLAYNTCPHQWALKYVKGLQEHKPSIHTVFGTAVHEVMQEWLTELYEGTVKKSNEMDFNTTSPLEKCKQSMLKRKKSMENTFLVLRSYLSFIMMVLKY
jgi:hypothetical protein